MLSFREYWNYLSLSQAAVSVITEIWITEPRRSYEKPVKTRTEIKIPLKGEEIESTKWSYVKEEVMVKKKPVTEIRNVTEKATSEKITQD